MKARKKEEFQAFIFAWWEKNKRDLPWRRTHNPYRILVAEIMLQQTQVLRVIPKYAEFIEAYPTLNSLARASTADMLRLWKGIGYNRRALYLKKTAEMVVGEYNGKFPKEEQLLVELPGLGTYTARAILVFAYKQNIAAVDTNIRKTITHFFFDGKPQKEKIIQSVADQLVPKGKSWEWHQALMDYGALALPRTVNPDPIGVNREQITKKKPFKDSNRFFRGRIIDILREKEMKELELIDDCAREYDRSEDFIQSILQGLEKDALIVRKNGILTLPE